MRLRSTLAITVRSLVRGVALGALLPLALAGCPKGDTDTEESDTDTDSDTDSDSDADTDSDSDADTDADADADTDADTDTDTDTDSGIIGGSGGGGTGQFICNDDAQEPNDDITTALPSTGDVDLVVCLVSPDYWSVDVPAGEIVEITMTDYSGTGDIDSILYDNQGAILDDGFTVTDTEFKFWENTTGADTTVVFQAYLWTGAPGPFEAYDLEVDTFVCEDALEPNDSITVATTGVTTQTGLSANAVDDDLFTIPVAASENLVVDVLYDQADGAVALTIEDAAGNVLDAGVQGVDQVNASWFNGSGTDTEVYARVANGGGSVCIDYDLASTNTFVVCNEDGFEDNDNLVASVNIPAGTYPLHTAVGDPDWFGIDVAENVAIEVGIVFDDTLADIGLRLVDGSATELASGNPLLYANPGTDTTVYLQVDASDGTCADYELTIEDATPDCTPDADEDNDTPADAIPAVDGSYNVSAGDDDYYTFDVADGEITRVSVDAPIAYGDLSMTLYDAAGNPLQQTAGGPDYLLEFINSTGVDATWTAQIEAASSPLECVPYDVTFQSTQCTITDPYEPNDTLITPTTGVTEATDAFANAVDDDYYLIGTVQDGETITVTLTHDAIAGDIDTLLFDATTSGQLAFALTSDDVEVVEWTNSTGAPVDVVFQVDMWTGLCNNAYEFTSTIQ